MMFPFCSQEKTRHLSNDSISGFALVEAAGIEPASASSPLVVLHA